MPPKDIPLSGMAGRAIIAIIDTAVDTRWDDALRGAATAPGATVEEKVGHLIRTCTRQLGALGAATGGTAAVPAVGTMTALGMTTAEIGAFTYRVTELILAIGAVHGHTYGGPDQRKAWVLSVLAYGDEAAAGYAEAAGMLGGRVVMQTTRGPSSHWFQRVNQFLGRRIITRWGTRKGAVFLGHLLPFGIGAAIGGAANVVMANRTGRHADRFFRQLPAGLAALPPPPVLPPPPASPAGLPA